MQTVIAVLSELGITSVIVAIAGKVWNDHFEFGSLLRTAFQLRMRLMLLITIAVVPILIYLLTHQGAPFFYSIMISMVLIADVYLRISINFQAIVPRFHSDITFLLVSETKAQFLRLILILVSIALFTNTVILLFLTFFGSLVNNFLLTQYTDNKIDRLAPISEVYKKQMVTVIKSQILYYFFFVTQGQITIFIISFFGKVESISDIGALSRLSVVFNFFNAAVMNFVSPRFAKEESLEKLRRLYLFVVFFFIIFSSSIILLSILFPEYFLWILGEKYMNLSTELSFMVFLTLISSLIGVTYSLNYSKAWIKNNWLIVPTTIFLQICISLCMDLSSVKNIIIFGIFSVIPNLIMNIYMASRGLKLFK